MGTGDFQQSCSEKADFCGGKADFSGLVWVKADLYR